MMNNSSSDKRVQIRLSKELYNMLENEAKIYGKSVSAWIQYLILKRFENSTENDTENNKDKERD